MIAFFPIPMKLACNGLSKARFAPPQGQSRPASRRLPVTRRSGRAGLDALSKARLAALLQPRPRVSKRGSMAEKSLPSPLSSSTKRA